jgi:hypothetical protein
VDVKPKKVKPKENTEKKLITNLVMMNLKQQQGATLKTLAGIGVSKFPTLLFTEEGMPLTNVSKSTYKMALLKRYGEHAFFLMDDLLLQQRQYS